MKREGGGGEGGEGGLYGTAILHSCQKEFCRQFVYLDARKMLSRRKFFNHQMDLVQIIYKNTIIEELVTKYNLFRTRLMWVEPKSCYTIHKDHSTRIHVPIITNPGALFVFRKGFMFNLEAGKIYWTDTTLEHTFANFSEHPRLHLVGCIK